MNARVFRALALTSLAMMIAPRIANGGEVQSSTSTAGGLTSDDVAARAVSTSLDLRARSAELDAAARAVDQALIAYFPRLSGTARYTRLSPVDETTIGPLVIPAILNQTALQASLQVPLSDLVLRIPRAHASASKSETAARLTRDATQLKVATEARLLYYAWLRSGLQLSVAVRAVDQANNHLVDVKHAVEAGTASPADQLAVESQVASSELLLERARNLNALAEHQVKTAMHIPRLLPIVPGEDVSVPMQPLERTHDVATMWEEAITGRMEVQALDAAIESIEHLASLERAAYLPRVDGFFDVLYSNPNARRFPQEEKFSSGWQAGLQVNFAVNDIFLGSARVDSALARAEKASADRAALIDALRTEVMQAHHAMREAEVAIATTQRGLAFADEAYRVRRVLFQNGRATSVELSDAETDLTRVHLEALNALVDLRVARTRLIHATARDVR